MKFFEWLSATVLVVRSAVKDIFDIDFENGVLNIRATTFKVGGVALPSGAALAAIITGLSQGKKFVAGQATLTSAATTIVTGLTTVTACGATLESDPILTLDMVQGIFGDQAGTPAAGSIIVQAWMPTGAALTTPIAATGYAGIKVNWWAFGS